MFWDCLRRCLLTVASKLGDERRASVGPLFLGSSPCGASSAVPKEGSQVMLSSQVNIRWLISWIACMEDWDCGFQWHLSPAISPLSHCYWAWKYWWQCWHGLVLWVCAIKLLGGVQYAQYWPHFLHPWFICHGLASWDGDCEILGS